MGVAMSITPMLVVQDVPAASSWLRNVFGWTSAHGGPEFEMLADSRGKVLMWLHVREASHDHAHVSDVDMTSVGRGVTFYVQVDDIEVVAARAAVTGAQFVEELHHNPRASHREFTVTGPEGYCFAAHTAYAPGDGGGS